MASAQCGASANSAARFLWSTMVQALDFWPTIAVILFTSSPAFLRLIRPHYPIIFPMPYPNRPFLCRPLHLQRLSPRLIRRPKCHFNHRQKTCAFPLRRLTPPSLLLLPLRSEPNNAFSYTYNLVHGHCNLPVKYMRPKHPDP
jgi:hypothetical protein